MSVQEHTIYEEIVNPIWDITKIPLVDKSTRQRELVTIFDQTGNSMFATHTPSSNQVLFQIRNNNSYLHLHDAYFKIKMRLVRTDGTALNADDIVAFCNNVGYTLFQSAHIRMNNRGIQSVDNVDHVTMLRLLTKLSKEELVTRGPEFFFFDYPNDNVRSLTSADDPTEEFTIAQADGIDVVTGRNTNYNKSFTVRYNKSATNADIVLDLPLKYIFSFVDDLNDLLIRRSDIDIELNITSNLNKCVEVVDKQAGYAGGFKPWIKYMVLKIPSLLPSVAVEAQLLESYNRESYSSIIYNNTICVKHTDHTQGSSTIRWRAASLPGKLNSIYIMFKARADEFAEDKVCNVYDNALVRRLYVKVGSTQLPMEQIECDFNQGDYSDAYTRFIESTKRNVNRIDEQSIVSWDNYPNKYPIFFVDLSALNKDDVTVSDEIWVEADLDTPGGGVIPAYSIFAIIEQEKMMLLSMHKDGRIAVS